MQIMLSFLLISIFSRSSSSTATDGIWTWLHFQIQETLDCKSLAIYLHGIVTDRCFPTDEPFFSLWDGENTSKDARSFRVTASLSPPVNNASLEPDWLPSAQDFVLETFSGAECGTESLLSRALLPYAQPSVEPGNLNLTSQNSSGSDGGSDGDGVGNNWRWSINGCSRSPWNAQQAMSLRVWSGSTPPTIIDFYSSYTDMTFFNSSASQDTCADFDSPVNFSVWRSGLCISLDGESSVMYSCPSPMFFGVPEDESPPHLFFPNSPNCTGNVTERSSHSQCEILPSMDTHTSYYNNTGSSESLFVIRRESCAVGFRENDWLPPVDENLFNDDGTDGGEHTPPPHNSSTSQPVVRIVVSLTISPLHENASHSLSFAEEKNVVESELLGLVCDTLSLPVEHCVLHSLSVQPQPTQSTLSQRTSHRHLRVSLFDTDTSLALFATVNVTLHKEDFPVTNNTTATATYNVTEQNMLLLEMGRSRSWNAFYTSALSFPHPLLTSSSYLYGVETDVFVLPPTPSLNIPVDAIPPSNNRTETVVVSSDTKNRHRLSLPALTGLVVGLSLLALLQAVVVYVSCCPHSRCAQLFSAKTMRVAPGGYD